MTEIGSKCGLLAENSNRRYIPEVDEIWEKYPYEWLGFDDTISEFGLRKG